MKSKLALTLSLALSLASWLLWAAREPARKAVGASSPPTEPAGNAREGSPLLRPPSTLVKQRSSAYHARLFADGEGAVLVTQAGFTLLRAGAVPEVRAMALGPVAVRQGETIVFWRSGWLREISLDGENEHRLTPLTQAPQYLLSSESRLAWIDEERATGVSLRTLSNGEVRSVQRSEGRVGAAVLRDATVYWLLQSPDGSWSIGGIGLDGQRPMKTGARRGRPPAMLALGPDGLYFYDGPERGVRRLTFDLDREDSVRSDVICSPLVVSNRPVCAHVGGLFDVVSSGAAPRLLASERDGPITALAATEDRVFWVAESGPEQLVVRTLPLPAL